MLLVCLEIKERRSDLRFRTSENKRREIPFMITNYEILIPIMYILNAGMEFSYWKQVSLQEIFVLCTSFVDEEADSFGQVIGMVLYRLTFELCCRTQYVQFSKWFHQFDHVNLSKKHARGTFPCTSIIAQLPALTLSS